MRERLSKLNSIDTKLAKLATIENSLFQVTHRVNDIEFSMEQLRNNFTTEFETLKKDKIEIKKRDKKRWLMHLMMTVIWRQTYCKGPLR